MGTTDLYDADPVRVFLAAKFEEDTDLDMAAVSRRIGKNHAYIQQFLRRGVPRKLPEGVRRDLATELNVDETILGGPIKAVTNVSKGWPFRDIGEYNALVSAGGGAAMEDEERVGSWPLPRAYLDEMRLTGGELAVVPVKGDSMEPTLRSGDRVLIDLGDKNISQGGIFCLWDGHGRVVKRVERVPGQQPERVRLKSDNPLHDQYEVPAAVIEIIGRVVWAARRL